MSKRANQRGEETSSPRARSIAVLGVALLIGLGLGRFATYQPSAVGELPTTPAAGADLIAELQSRTEEQPGNVTLWQKLGQASLQRAAQVGDPQLYVVAETALGKAQALVEDDPTTILGFANLALARHQFSEAHELANQAANANPDAAEPLLALFDASIELGRYDEAEGHLDRLLNQKPNLAALARLSYFRELHGDRRGALQAMLAARTAGAASPFETAQVETFIGNLLYGQGELARSLEAYDRALVVAPETVLAMVGKARVLAAAGQPDDAIDLLQQAVDRYPLAEAVVLLGELQAATGEQTAAKQTFQLVGAIGQLQQQAGAVVDMEMALFQSDHGDATIARDLAAKAYAQRPTIYAADALGWATFKSGDVQAAVALIEEATRLGTADAALRFHAASVYAGAGLVEQARVELQTALDLNPSFSLYHQPEIDRLRVALGV